MCQCRNSDSKKHNHIYGKPVYYDIVFSYRNFGAEVDFLQSVFRANIGREIASVIELACGPGDHAIEFSRRGIKSTGLDISPEMVDYAVEKNRNCEAKARFIRGDMLDFKLEEPADMALLMISSLSYILNGDDFVKHLRTVEDNLTPNGVYFIEAPHPSSLLTKDPRTKNNWKMEKDGIEVEMTWGFPTDPFDPITQISETGVLMKVSENRQTFEYKDKSPQKEYSYQEIRALIELSGVFEIVGEYGSFNINQPFDNSEKSWRMNLALKKK
jgi:SAM-dependent methyltransferase